MPERRKLSFTVHGHPAQNERVIASVFSQKLGALVRGLKRADERANGGEHYEYVIADLGIGSARAALDEVLVRPGEINRSAVAAYADCVDSLSHSDFRKALAFGGTVDAIAALTSGAGRRFSHADIEIDDGRAFRVDPFLERQAAQAKRLRKEEQQPLRYFTGTADGAFDGEIQEVDLRGAIPQVKLILSAGGVEIDCVMRGFLLEDIRAALKQRARVEGKAIYSGDSGLPARIEIRSITPLGPPNRFRRWRGSFEPFEASDWDNES